MTPNEAIITCFRKYLDFKGRASRPEFWWFTAFGILLGLIISHDIFYSSLAVEILAIIIGLAILFPNISVTVRRLHDTNKSGYWAVPFFAFPFIPDWLLYKFHPIFALVFAGLILVYVILMIYWLTLKGNEYENDFGFPYSVESQS